ncbi:RelA/SpoT family protein [Helicobacter mustelae]|uniref:Putative guanosine-3',5'-bis(Diphosphate) 3'-pyrophosphohydrolase n=1 Tax=Helicobacter mustelae (strain ATCC 43772 / CCUG 25715 / CIP 103759 / LMG 18044 / NCTC 12198 / R85-136P) TaxID=679897 RepID=D3UH82_HELM1|nr:RelA/SpoT family protein [Helicobacter mustelae]CBG39854.1 putative guanosine-3',5'-bis(diphosphate) 3'-pyrophosphohydrolase [Helicobacter mustelae 12198]SQH71363.1 guanosine-3',5'-bis(diphosphate) 3'-pyrophosphohydrolase [Helicobacter mustelae]STP12490.1 guanosine-3',5'-bis(diphosphate) 3'-pyrophosphohydrolase [Helicobacter mustelae]
MNFLNFQELAAIRNPEEGIQRLFSILTPTDRIKQALEVATKYHQGQKRKSGEPYIVHPICVACIVASYGKNEAMVCAALLHDVVEDTDYRIEDVEQNFGLDVAILVDALTKISEVRKEELRTQTPEKVIIAALSFRKMLVAAVKDPRALVIKISDRLHNMLTLDALPEKKQKSISEETLVVYAPIAHRLGISSIKNELEDRAFYYLFPQEYQKIQNFLEQNNHSFASKLQTVSENIQSLLLKNGFTQNELKLEKRLKRPYSIYLKMQRKGVDIDEILDLLAIRIIVNDVTSCYKVLGMIHSNFKPIMSRFKDYIALPKENGYQTIHTTVFHQSMVYEIQIRTFDMHASAQYGVAAHWKYKSGALAPNMDWLYNFEYQNNSIEEFYELAKNDLYQEDIVVFSPAGDTYTLPVGAVALDFAYAVHSEVGDSAFQAYINNQKTSLLQVLKSGDIVRIITSKNALPKYTWIEEVKTSRAKSCLKTQRQNRIRDIENRGAIGILANIFGKKSGIFKRFLSMKGLVTQNLWKITRDKNALYETVDFVKEKLIADHGFFVNFRLKMIKIKPYKLDRFIVHSPKNIKEVLFDCCCHPKYGDEILGIYVNQCAIVHHKLCDKLYEELNNGESLILFVEWVQHALPSFKAIIALGDRKTSITKLVNILSQNGSNVIGLNYAAYKDQFSVRCEVIFENDKKNAKRIKELLQHHYKIIEFKNMQDAYQK